MLRRLSRPFSTILQADKEPMPPGSSTPIESYLTGRKDIKRLFIDDKIVLNHDSFVMRCTFDADKVIGVPPGYHLRIHFANKALEEGRTFTPINSLSALGRVDFLVKVYLKSPTFPSGGSMTQYLHSLKVGGDLFVTGPVGKYLYKGDGVFEFKLLKMVRSFSSVSFIAGGTGITPIYQILNNLKTSDATKFNLIYANKSESDILLKKSLDRFVTLNPNIKISYTIENPPAEGWVHHTGRVGEKIIEMALPSPDEEDHLVFICGPKQMNEAVRDELVGMGYEESNIYFY